VGDGPNVSNPQVAAGRRALDRDLAAIRALPGEAYLVDLDSDWSTWLCIRG